MADSLGEELKAAAGLQLARVITTDGRLLGHLFDLRCEWRPASAHVKVSHLIYGRRGLLERLGFRERFVAIPWEAVIEMREREIVVRAA